MGVMGKLISPQNIAVGAAATNLIGREGELNPLLFSERVPFLIYNCIFYSEGLLK